MSKQELFDIAQECIENKWDLCVAVTIPGQDTLEYIINKRKSIPNKLKYYEEMYNDELRHRMHNGVKVIRAFGIDFYDGE